MGLSVADLDSAKQWYANVLGTTQGFLFELAPFGVRGCFMEGHGTRIELLERAGSGGPPPGSAVRRTSSEPPPSRACGYSDKDQTGSTRSLT